MIKEAINEYGSSLNREFSHDRSKTVGASEIGLCARRVGWLKHGATTDAQQAAAAHEKKPKTKAAKDRDMRGATQAEPNWGAHVRGTVIEKHLWLPAMKAKFGANLVMAGKEQKTIVRGNLSATPDGLVRNRGHEVLKNLGYDYDPKSSKDLVVECKSIDPRVNLTEEKSENAYQVQVQMGLIRATTPYRPDHAVISYVDASFWHEVAEFVVPFKQDEFEAADLRAGKILHADPSDLKPEGWISGGKECGYCPYYKRCAVLRNDVPESEAQDKVTEQFKAEIIDLCKQVNTLTIAGAATEKQKNDLKDQIKDRLKAKGVRRVQGVVNWYRVKGRESWDVDAMITALERKKIDVSPFLSKGEPTSSLNVDKKVALL